MFKYLFGSNINTQFERLMQDDLYIELHRLQYIQIKMPTHRVN